jgi:hypothetical protein
MKRGEKMKKIICIAILTLFLLAGFTASPVLGTLAESSEKQNISSMSSTQNNAFTYETRHAVIVVGVYNGQQFYTWYLSAVQNLYNSLLSERYGFTAEEVYVLLVVRGDYVKPEIFNPEIVDGPATKEEISSVLAKFKTGAELAHTENDMLMFTWIGHGNVDYFELENGAIYPNDLKGYMQNIQGRMIVVLQPCMSGSFIGDLAAQNRIICTSVGPISAEGGWIETFIEAMNGAGDYRPADGRISLEEMFYHAANHVSEQFKFSRLDDNFDGVGHGPFWLDGIGYDINDPTKDGYLASRVYDLRYEEPLVVTINGPSYAKPNEEIQLGATVTGGVGPYTYSWDFDDTDGIQEDSTEQTPTTTYTEKKDYKITLTVTDSQDRTGFDTFTITIKTKSKTRLMHFLSINEMFPNAYAILKLLLKL